MELKHLRQVEFIHWNQKLNETHQEFEADVARLVRLYYSVTSDEILQLINSLSENEENNTNVQN